MPTFTPDAVTRRAWTARYERALDRLKAAGVKTTPNPAHGVEEYIRQRSNWEGPIRTLGPYMAYTREQIDPCTHGPESATNPPSHTTHDSPSGWFAPSAG